MEIVCDSSTLILLARAGLLGRLLDHADVVIPEEVFRETVVEGKKAGKEDAFVIEKWIADGKITVAKARRRDFVDRLLGDFRMELGEAEAIALCLERRAPLVGADDREAIKACRVYGIKFITALSFAVFLAREGMIPPAEAGLALEKLEKAGFYSDEIVNEARKESGLNGTSG